MRSNFTKKKVGWSNLEFSVAIFIFLNGSLPWAFVVTWGQFNNLIKSVRQALCWEHIKQRGFCWKPDLLSIINSGETLLGRGALAYLLIHVIICKATNEEVWNTFGESRPMEGTLLPAPSVDWQATEEEWVAAETVERGRTLFFLSPFSFCSLPLLFPLSTRMVSERDWVAVVS